MKDNFEQYTPWGVIKYVPGFRTGKLWKMLLSSLIYAALMFISIINMQEFRGTGTLPYIIALVGVAFWLWVGPLVIADVAYWTKKVKIFSRMGKAPLVICRTWFGTMFISFGYYLVIFAGEMAGLEQMQ